MKHIGKLCASAVLTSVLAVSAAAGDMNTPGIKLPPPPEGTSADVSTDSGIEPIPGNSPTGNETAYTSPLLEVTLNIIDFTRLFY